jgi:hypothetical protein
MKNSSVLSSSNPSFKAARRDTRSSIIRQKLVQPQLWLIVWRKMMEISLGATIVAKGGVGIVLVKTTIRSRIRLPRRCRTGVRKLRSGD